MSSCVSISASGSLRSRAGRAVLLALAGVSLLAAGGCQWLPGGRADEAPGKVCIAHRGASAYAPEHTIKAYELAMEMGADYVEQDLQLTRDGVLVCLHDISLERTTNVEDVFPDRFREGTGGSKTWPVVEFTLAEIRQLDAGSWFDAKFAGERVPTFQEAIDLVRGRAGIYPELKEPGYYESYGMNMVDAVAAQLESNGLNTAEAQKKTPVLLQSFSPEALKQMRAKIGTTYPLIQLVDLIQARALTSDEGLQEVATYAQGLGPAIAILRGDPTRVHKAHELGLQLHPYTVSEANRPTDFADLEAYTSYLLYDLGVDGVFTNNPDVFPRKRTGE